MFLFFIILLNLQRNWLFSWKTNSIIDELVIHNHGEAIRWIVGSNLHGGPIELLLVPASAPRLVQQRPWYVLSCLWDGAYKSTLTVLFQGYFFSNLFVCLFVFCCFFNNHISSYGIIPRLFFFFIAGLCASAKVVNGVGYRLHPTECNKYVLCYYRDDGYAIAVIKTCPFDQYWNQQARKCEPSCDVTCPIGKVSYFIDCSIN